LGGRKEQPWSKLQKINIAIELTQSNAAETVSKINWYSEAGDKRGLKQNNKNGSRMWNYWNREYG
jgi:hypothetical protein